MNQNNIIQNCLRYTGNKDRIMPLLVDSVPQEYSYVIDLFGGSGTCGVNLGRLNKSSILYNEKDKYIYNIIRTIKECDLDFILNKIDFYRHSYGLGKNNKDNYLTMRKDFNRLQYKELEYDYSANIMLLTMSYFAFNNFITFNKDGKFTTPSGYKRMCYNENIKNKLIKFKREIDELTFITANEDFRDIVYNIMSIYDIDMTKCLFVIDPPYIVSDSQYLRTYGNTWSIKDEEDLYNICKNIDKKGGKFILINQVKKGDLTNDYLLDFAQNFNIVDTRVDFGNCNYQRKNKGNDKEILVKNY